MTLEELIATNYHPEFPIESEKHICEVSGVEFELKLKRQDEKTHTCLHSGIEFITLK